MRLVRRVSFLGLIVGLVGCGAATQEITASLNSFQCRSADFAQLDAALSKVFKTGNYFSADGRVYSTLEAFNAKLAAKCPAPALVKCSPKAQKVVRGNAIVGPVNAFGVSGNTELKTIYRHDGFARSPEPQLHYSVAVSAKIYREGLACFAQATP